MNPTQKQMTDLYHLASGSQFDDAPKALRVTLPYLAMKMDDSEEELDVVAAHHPGLCLTDVLIRGDIRAMKEARDAYNAACAALVERLERHYAPEKSGLDKALDDADHCNEYHPDGAE